MRLVVFVRLFLFVGFLFHAQVHSRVVYLTGTPSLSVQYVKALNRMCTPQGGEMVIYKQESGTSSLGYQFTVKCSQNYYGVSGVDVVAFYLAGSSSAVHLSWWGRGGPVSFVKPEVPVGGQVVFGSGSLANFRVVPGVAGVFPATYSEGGFMDMDPAAFDSSVFESFGGAEGLADKVAPSAFYRAYGLAVNRNLYAALQAAQGLTAKGCGVDDMGPGCQPTISRAQYASLASMAANSAKLDPGGLLGVSSAKLRLCRFKGVIAEEQVASNAYFLNSVLGGGPNGGSEVPADRFTYGSSTLPYFDVFEGVDKNQVKTCLSSEVGYAAGVLSLTESSPYIFSRFVKINRVEGFDLSSKSKMTAIGGEYDFLYRGAKFSAAGAGNSAIIDFMAEFISLDSDMGMWAAGTQWETPNSQSLFYKSGSSGIYQKN